VAIKNTCINTIRYDLYSIDDMLTLVKKHVMTLIVNCKKAGTPESPTLNPNLIIGTIF